MKFGRLKIIEDTEEVVTSKGGNKIKTILAECDCGSMKRYRLPNLRSGHTQSCGCLWEEQKHLPRYTTHSMTKTGTYKSWRAMLDRCYRPETNGYHNYGGRGIKVCPLWHSFDVFLKDMGVRPVGTSLDRIETDKDYEPTNCRWATNKEQAENRRNSIKITFNGKTQSLNDWASELNIPRSTIYGRYKDFGLRGYDCLKPSRKKKRYLY